MATKDKKPVKRMSVTKAPEVLAAETIIAVTTSHTIQDAADKLGISRQMVHERIKRYGLQEKIAALKEDALAELQMGATAAARNLVNKVHSENDNVSLGASNSILDRIGLTKEDKSGATSTIIFNRGDIVKDKYVKD